MRKILKYIIISHFVIFGGYNSSVSAFEYAIADNGFKYVVHKHNELSYQKAWVSLHGGIEEFENADKTRVDVLTDTHAIEFDFANKWAEAVGQALHYQYMTGKRAKVILILEDPKEEMVYYYRVKKLGEIHNFDVEYVTPEILDLKDGKCQFKDCRCHKKHHHSSIIGNKLKKE